MTPPPMTIPRTTIPRNKPADAGLDYVALVEEGTRLVQAMSGHIWTDYNFSDPGVTILEQLCYALTELSYRADFPVQDLICDPATGQVVPSRHGLYPAPSILPVNPVTADDFRRLVIDRVAEVGNAWFTPCLPAQSGGVSGLYAVAVLVPAIDPCCEHHSPHPNEIRRLVADCYSAHRALCEDVRDIVVLRHLPTVVSADVQLDDGTDPSTVLGRLQFTLGLHLAPEPQRTSLDAQLAAGRTTAEIFSGPLMLQGFIADDQLTPLPGVVPIDDILQVMAETPGVLSVDRLSVRVDGKHDAFGPGDTIHVPDGSILSLMALPRDGAFSIRLFRGEVVCRPHPARVARVRDRLWAAQRRTYDLGAEYAARYQPPVGQRVDLAAYSSVQDQFPKVYGIGAYGLPRNAGAARNAQARQLKGYLMPFDQLMADYFSQLAFLRELFSVCAGGDTTYAFQSLRPIVPNAAPLLGPDYEAGLAALVAADQPVVARQLAILELLLSLYAEGLAPPADAACGADDATPGSALLRARQALLTRMEPATHDRGRGFDYRPGGPMRCMAGLPVRRMAGLEVRCRIELALLDQTRGASGPLVVRDPAEASFGVRATADLAETVVGSFLPLDAVDDMLVEAARDDASLLAGQRVAADLWAALPDARRYRIGRMPGDGRVHLACRDMADGWWILGWYPGAAEAIVAAERLVHAADGPGEHLFIVEWMLLRYAAELGAGGEISASELSFPGEVDTVVDGRTTSDHDGDDSLRTNYDQIISWPTRSGDAGARYSFRVSAVVAASETQAADAGWRSQVTDILRQAMPAHVALDCLFLGHDRMRRFRRLHVAWVHALRDGSAERRAETSRRLQEFLQPPAAPPVPDPVPPEPPPSEPPPAVTLVPSPPEDPVTAEPPAEPATERVAAEAPPAGPATERGVSRWQRRFPRREPDPPAPVPLTLPLPPELAAKRRWWRRLRFPGGKPVSAPALPPPEAVADVVLPGRIEAVPSGARGFDTATPLTAASASAFVVAGFRFTVRHLSAGETASPDALTSVESLAILQAGLALMAMQRVAVSGSVPSEALGQQYGRTAAASARAVGFPAGVTIWLDLDGVPAETNADAVIAFCNAWFRDVAAAGYAPGMCVGPDTILSEEQLEVDLRVRHYWNVGAAVQRVPIRGWCMLQDSNDESEVGGVAYAGDTVQADHLRGTPTWLAPDSGGA
jgi:hypothetical protein